MRALRHLEGLAEKARIAVAAPILVLIAVLDSVSWLVSFCIDLVLGVALVAVLTAGRGKRTQSQEGFE